MNPTQLVTNYFDDLAICASGLQSPAFTSQLAVVSTNYVNPIIPLDLNAAYSRPNTYLAKLDGALGFLSLAVSSVAYLIIHAITAVAAAPFALLDTDASRFFKVQVRKAAVDFDAILVGISGTFSPDYGCQLVWDNVKKIGSEMFDISIKHGANAIVEASNQPAVRAELTNYGLTQVDIADLQSAVIRVDYAKIKEVVRRSLFANAQFQVELTRVLGSLDFNDREIQTIRTDLNQFNFEKILALLQPRLNNFRQGVGRQVNGLF